MLQRTSTLFVIIFIGFLAQCKGLPLCQRNADCPEAKVCQSGVCQLPRSPNEPTDTKEPPSRKEPNKPSEPDTFQEPASNKEPDGGERTSEANEGLNDSPPESQTPQQSVHGFGGTKSYGGLGGSQLEELQTSALVSDHQGNVYIAGLYTGTALLGPSLSTTSTSKQLFVAKYNSQTGFAWVTASYQQQGEEEGQLKSVDMALDNDGNLLLAAIIVQGKMYFGNQGGWVVGKKQNHLLFAKLKVKGETPTWQWVQRASGHFITPKILAGQAGSFYIAGGYITPIKESPTVVDFGNNVYLDRQNAGQDIFVAKGKSADGKIIWAKGAGGSQDDSLMSCKYAEGMLFVAGVFESIAPTQANEKMTFGRSSLTLTANGHGIAGPTQAKHLFVAGFDTSKEAFVWAKGADAKDGEINHWANDLVVLPSSGGTQSTRRVFVVGSITTDTHLGGVKITPHKQGFGGTTMFLAEVREKEGKWDWSYAESFPASAVNVGLSIRYIDGKLLLRGRAFGDWTLNQQQNIAILTAEPTLFLALATLPTQASPKLTFVGLKVPKQEMGKSVVSEDLSVSPDGRWVHVLGHFGGKMTIDTRKGPITIDATQNERFLWSIPAQSW